MRVVFFGTPELAVPAARDRAGAAATGRAGHLRPAPGSAQGRSLSEPLPDAIQTSTEDPRSTDVAAPKPHRCSQRSRITSYNVCYTKLLRPVATSRSPPRRAPPSTSPPPASTPRITSYNVCYTKLLRARKGTVNCDDVTKNAHQIKHSTRQIR